jgi:hypothetical protein
MAHFAQLDDNNVVLQVIVVADEHEANGEQWCHDFAGGRWKQTSRTARIRKNYAGIGYTYDEQRDAFIPPKPFPSWTLVEETCRWQAPIPQPDDGYKHKWLEALGRWIPVNRWLFENYGLTQDASLIAAAVEKYGLEDRKMVAFIEKPEYLVQLEKANNILFIHVRIPLWTAEIKTALQAAFYPLHEEIGCPLYAYQSVSNEELQGETTQLVNFAKLFGFVEFENVVLADGLEHLILKREIPTP